MYNLRMVKDILEVRLTFSGFSNWRVELLFDDRLVNVGWIMGLG